MAEVKAKKTSNHLKDQVTQTTQTCTQGTQTEDSEGSQKKAGGNTQMLVQRTLEEYPILRHAFDLVRNSSLSEFSPMVKECCQKIARSISGGSDLVKHVGSMIKFDVIGN